MAAEKKVHAGLEDAPERSPSDDTRDIDPVAANRVVRKFDFNIMPWLFGLWFFAALDRANIGKPQFHLTVSAIDLLKATRRSRTFLKILNWSATTSTSP